MIAQIMNKIWIPFRGGSIIAPVNTALNLKMFQRIKKTKQNLKTILTWLAMLAVSKG